MDRFLIFALERSGSSSLAAALNRDMSVVQEPFSALTGDLQTNDKFIRLVTDSGYLPENLPEDDGDLFAYNRFHGLARDPVVCANYLEMLYGEFTGIKHVRNTVSLNANFNIIDWCLGNGVKIVYLTRKKLGEALLSRFLAQQAEVHQLGDGMQNREKWESTQFEPIDIEMFENQLNAFQQAENEYREYLAGKPCHFITYEQLYQGWLFRRRRAFNSLCRYLSIKPGDLDRATLDNYLFNPKRKQTNRRAVERVPNYRELKRYL